VSVYSTVKKFLKNKSVVTKLKIQILLVNQFRLYTKLNMLSIKFKLYSQFLSKQFFFHHLKLAL